MIAAGFAMRIWKTSVWDVLVGSWKPSDLEAFEGAAAASDGSDTNRPVFMGSTREQFLSDCSVVFSAEYCNKNLPTQQSSQSGDVYGGTNGRTNVGLILFFVLLVGGFVAILVRSTRSQLKRLITVYVLPKLYDYGLVRRNHHPADLVAGTHPDDLYPGTGSQQGSSTIGMTGTATRRKANV
jgi:hypothetical protein